MNTIKAPHGGCFDDTYQPVFFEDDDDEVFQVGFALDEKGALAIASPFNQMDEEMTVEKDRNGYYVTLRDD